MSSLVQIGMGTEIRIKLHRPFRELSLANLPCGCILYGGADVFGGFNSHDRCLSKADHVGTADQENNQDGDYVQIGGWRLARTCENCGDNSHFSVSSQRLHKTSQIFRSTGSLHPGPRSDFHGFDLVSSNGLTFSSQPIVFGNKAVQIRDWRIRQIDARHLSVSNENGNVSRIYRSDGTVHGNNKDYSGYNIEDLGKPTCAYLTSSYLQIGDWRFGEIGTHLSVTHKGGKTAMIYRDDGRIFGGPRTDFNAWSLQDGEFLMGSNEGCDIRTANLEDLSYDGSRCRQGDEDYDFFFEDDVISDWDSSSEDERFVTCATFCHPYTTLPGYVGFATERRAGNNPDGSPNFVNRCLCFFDDDKLPGSNPVSNEAHINEQGTAVGLVNSGRPNTIGKCYPYRFYNTRSLCTKVRGRNAFRSQRLCLL